MNTDLRRDNEERWEVLRPLVAAAIQDCKARFGDRRISVADYGALDGWFSDRVSSEFDNVGVNAFDKAPMPPSELPGQARYRKLLSAGSMRAMARHDVVLALSILHHMSDWREALDQIAACRGWAIVEIPDPQERWMKHAEARHELDQIEKAVAAMSVGRVGPVGRTGRDGVVYQRWTYLVPGTLQSVTGQPFDGSGGCSRNLPKFSRGLDRELGYRPFPGSLNLSLDTELVMGFPEVDWVGEKGNRTRDYQFWEAWLKKQPIHAMVPGSRGHGPRSLELVAPNRLRDLPHVSNSTPLQVDVRATRTFSTIESSSGELIHLWDLPGKVTKCFREGKPYEAPLLNYLSGFRDWTGTAAIDAGANVGNHTLWFSLACGFDRVYAFEPVRIRELSRNIQLNRVGDTVAPIDKALNFRKGRAQHTGKGVLKAGGKNLPIEMVRLDSYGFENVGLIKIDVEGMESKVLQGAVYTIEKSRPVIAAEQWNSAAEDEIRAVVAPLGYELERTFPQGESTKVGLWIAK